MNCIKNLNQYPQNCKDSIFSTFIEAISKSKKHDIDKNYLKQQTIFSILHKNLAKIRQKRICFIYTEKYSTLAQ